MVKRFSIPISESLVYVSLDLETTGLDAENDEIIEISAIKFQDEEIIDTFESLINPHRSLSFRIQNLCGITQQEVDSAPELSLITSELVSFLGTYPVIGHSIQFDIGFLSSHGIKLANQCYDTYELANLFLPDLSDYSLSTVARHLGISYPQQHRALPDAVAAKDVFLSLLNRISSLGLDEIAEIEHLVKGSGLSLERLFHDIKILKVKTAFNDKSKPVFMTGTTTVLKKAEPLIPGEIKEPLDEAILTDILGTGSALSSAFPRYEYRQQQVEMMQAVIKAFNNEEYLIAEAGTGTGKSIAYLLPSAMFAIANSVHIVISTGTINLQEQLLNKDIPDLVEALGLQLRAVKLKGRSNYLCRRRLSILRKSGEHSQAEIRLLIRIMMWLPLTNDADKAELSMNPDQLSIWDKVCAQVDNCLGGNCPFMRRETCFLYKARQAAEEAHIIVVNHALLLSDIATGGNILPDYRYLVIDEAHHLEEVATDQFGFKITQWHFVDYLNRLSEDVDGQRYGGIVPQINYSVKTSKVTQVIQKEISELAEIIRIQCGKVRSYVIEFYNSITGFVEIHGDGKNGYEIKLRITGGIRTQPQWYRIEVSWENLSLELKGLLDTLETLTARLEPLTEHGIPDIENILLELNSLSRSGLQLYGEINALVFGPKDNFIYWASMAGRQGTITLCGAPQHVGEMLGSTIFTTNDSIVLTGATLSVNGTFDYIKERLGLEYVNELILGTPFDYANSTKIFIAGDIPEPTRTGYQQALSNILINLCRATRGRALILFTSHASLRATYAAIQAPLGEESILVVGQGIDGSPRRVLSAFADNPRAVLLGAASFWEGVDIVGDALSLLVIVRLPFSVPTDPVIEARSEMFDDPFTQYTLPQAILKFKQGFGRLIRSSTDRGVMVVLDKRIQSKNYGRSFIKSLPQAEVLTVPAGELPNRVTRWLKID